MPEQTDASIDCYDVAAAPERVDRENLILHGVVVAEAGPTKDGRPAFDGETLRRIAALGNENPKGIKSHLTHDWFYEKTFGTHLGRLKNYRVDGGKVRADLHFSKAAAKSPKGNLIDYVMDLADSDPDAISMSPAFTRQTAIVAGQKVSRPTALHAVDVVSEGNVTTSLFSAGAVEMSTEIKAELVEATERVVERIVEKVVPDLHAVETARSDATAATKGAERKRAADILALCAAHSMESHAAEWIGNDAMDVNDVRDAILTKLAKKRAVGGESGVEPTPTSPPDAIAEAYDRLNIQRRFGVTLEQYRFSSSRSGYSFEDVARGREAFAGK